ncbi:hypothetical protein DB30_02718 [Enhygromyxa salina]|uniref:Uncharacterized protein n=1 Tax=Enhygromyxa salina TaxID=215803 RepID=A0A0C2DIE3_9BACT|nr:hypothetical protein DB30_02718 [Enhygromyxa salina]
MHVQSMSADMLAAQWLSIQAEFRRPIRDPRARSRALHT